MLSEKFPDLVTKRNKKPGQSLMPQDLQTSKYNSSPLIGQIVKLEPLLSANTFASPDLNVFVQKWLKRNPELSGKRKISTVLDKSKSAARSPTKNST